jgi:hypothetical protein
MAEKISVPADLLNWLYLGALADFNDHRSLYNAQQCYWIETRLRETEALLGIKGLKRTASRE